MIKKKINVDLIMIQIIWMFLLMRIAWIDYKIWLVLEILVCILCTMYLLKNIRYFRKDIGFGSLLIAGSYLFSSLLNRQYNGLYVTTTGVVYAWKIFIIFNVIFLAVKKAGSKKTIQASWNCLMLYWIISVVTVFLQKNNTMNNADNIYFIGNKFNVAYLNVILVCLCQYLSRKNIVDSEKSRLLKKNKKTIFTCLFYVNIIYLDVFMKAYTGLFMVIFVITLSFLSKVLQFKIGSRWHGFYKFISRPSVVCLSVFLSGIMTLILGVILTIPRVASYLDSIGKMGNIISRTLIYENLADIISKKKWNGYGYGSAIVTQYFGPNAQNGLAQVAIYSGIIGVLLLLFMVVICCKMGKINGEMVAPFLFSIYAFILAATIEITYGSLFFAMLAFYSACGLANECEVKYE